MTTQYMLCKRGQLGVLDYFDTKEEALKAFEKTKGPHTLYKRRVEYDIVVLRT